MVHLPLHLWQTRFLCPFLAILILIAWFGIRCTVGVVCLAIYFATARSWIGISVERSLGISDRGRFATVLDLEMWFGVSAPWWSDPNRKTLYNQRPQKRRISMYTLQFPVESHLARPDNPGRTYGAFCHHSWRLTVHQLQNPCFRYDKHDSSLLGLVLNTATLPLKRMCGEHPRSTCLEFDVLAIYAHSGWQISLFSGGARLNDNGESGHLVGLWAVW
jgi:hypothetical protein